MLKRLDSAAPANGDPVADACRAQLTYVNDSEPGIRRRRAGKGFFYRTSEGERISDPRTLARIRALAIPPAWSEVWICPHPDGHIQATGRDQRGRKQYRYHPDWQALRDEAKFSSLTAFARLLPGLREQVEADLRRRGVPRERAVASIVWLLDRTMIRIGNESYARQNMSFGLTTLESRHVSVEGTSLRFSFRGKSGQEWKLRLQDRRIAGLVRTIQDLPGQHLFQYLDEEGRRHPVHSHDVNAYIRAHAGEAFTSKHFRTWGATRTAAVRLAAMERPQSKRAATRALNEVLDRVARRLRNTRAVCRRCYVHPVVVEAWQEGRLAAELAAIRRRNRRALKGLDEEESMVLRWLDALDRGAEPEPVRTR